MTGDGTQVSPFIPANWNELVTAAASSGAYVQLPAFETWDMNELYPEGITAPLVVNCTEIDGNYTTIKNLFVDNNTLRADAIQCNGNLIKNLSLVDFIHSGNSYDYMMIEEANFYNCKISGVQEGTSKNFTGNATVSKFDRCSLNMEGGKISKSNDRALWLNSEISIETTTATSTGRMYRCKLTGHIGSNANLNTVGSTVLGYQTEDTVVDIYGTGTVTSSISTMVINCIINKDKWTGTIQGNYSKVTSEQMVDAEYLRSIGFMAGDA